jgi:hypothetical protein
VSKNWAEEQARTIGQAVRELRGKKTGQWLSDETERAGHRVPRTTISELESGKRKSVSTAELCLLAWALKVPPVRLLYPNLPDGPVEIIPGKTVPSIEAATWFSGETTYMPKLPETNVRNAADDPKWRAAAEEAVQVARGARLVQLARERLKLETRVRSLPELVDRLKSENPALVDSFVDEITSAQNGIKSINRDLKQTDGAVVINDGG